MKHRHDHKKPVALEISPPIKEVRQAIAEWREEVEEVLSPYWAARSVIGRPLTSKRLAA
jgi:hypothetical protein